MSFAGLHNHTMYSNGRLKDSIIKPKNALIRANEVGWSAYAITDHECISGHIKMITLTKELKEKGILPKDFKTILGNEIYLCDREIVLAAKENNERIDFYHLIVLAKNEKGHEAIRKLSAESWINAFHYRGLQRVPTYKDYFFQILEEYKGNLIVSSSCLGGELPKLSKKYLRDKDIETKREIHKFITQMKYYLGDDFYIEIQPNSIDEEQIEFNKFALILSKAYNVKIIVTTDSHYLEKKHFSFQKIFLASKDGEREDVEKFYATTYMMSEDEIKEHLISYIDEDMIQEFFDNTMEIANKVEEYDLYQILNIPEAEIPDYKLNHIFYKYYDKYEYIKKYAYSEHDIDTYFLYLIEQGFIEKNQEFNEENISRINIELRELWEMSLVLKQQLSGYYVTTKQMIDLIWEVSFIGISRGSASGFYTAYLINIVQLNPIKHGLYHWRHLSVERGVELPDIDFDSMASKREIIIEKMKEHYGYDKIINIATFKQEKAKSAVFTACKGIGLDTDTIDNIKKLATHPTLTDCLFGNEEEGLSPIKEFIEEIKKYEGLEEAILLFEGLVTGFSSHASGVVYYNKGILAHNSIMKTNGGLTVTAYDYDDTTYCGGMKFDYLSLSAMDKLYATMQLLIQDGKIEEQENLRALYNKYIHPDVIEWDNPEVYKLLYSGEVIDAFQMDSPVGRKALQKIKPHTFQEVTTGNSLMRLKSKGDIQPIDKFVAHKEDITIWYKELEEAGLNEEEQEIMKEMLGKTYGVADTQELAMLLSMHPKIANFDLGLSNKLRKAISKKKDDLLNEIKIKFYSKGEEVGTRKELLDYVWNNQILLQKGYAFSINHQIPYSAILLQELNLCYKYGTIYWKTAVLSETIGDNGGVAVAVGNMKDTVINPDINLSKKGFAPLESENKILYGLLSIDGIGESVVDTILENRPFADLNDFYVRMVEDKKITPLQMFILAKSGSLDCLSSKNRKDIMIELVQRITPKKDKLTMSNVSKMYDKIPNELSSEKKLYWFRNIYLKNQKKDKDNFYISVDALDFINSNFSFTYDISDNIIINIKEFEKYYKKNIVGIQKWIATEEALEIHHKALCRETWNEYCSGDFSSWEMDTIYFYTQKHELDSYNLESMFTITNFNELSETPIIDKIEVTKKGKEYTIFKTSVIAGTVVDKNKDKKLVYILTKDGVVPVKFYESNYKKYDKKIVEGEGKNKKVLSESYFKRGTKLIVTGYRKLDEFIPKVYNFNSSPIVKTFKENGKVQFEFEKMK